MGNNSDGPTLPPEEWQKVRTEVERIRQSGSGKPEREGSAITPPELPASGSSSGDHTSSHLLQRFQQADQQNTQEARAQTSPAATPTHGEQSQSQAPIQEQSGPTEPLSPDQEFEQGMEERYGGELSAEAMQEIRQIRGQIQDQTVQRQEDVPQSGPETKQPDPPQHER